MKEWGKELELLKKEGLYRQLKRLDSAQSPRVVISGEEVIMLASNNYLGLSVQEEIKNKVIKTIKKYGTGAGGSRLTTGNYDLHQQLEDKLADFKGCEAALIFNTGYMANLGVLTSVVGTGDLIISDELNHASIIDGCQLSEAEVTVYQHCNLENLEAKLKLGQRYNSRLIVTDGIFSMDGNLAPLPEIVELARKYDSLVMVDDAHGTGVLGSTGAGSVEYFGLKNQIDIQLGTLSKALAAEGGFVAGSQKLIDLLRNKARSFIYSTALAPGTIRAGLAAITYLEDNLQILKQLEDRIKLLKKGLIDLGYQILPSDSAIIPIMIGSERDTMELSIGLLEAGVLAPAIRPPTVPTGTSRIRATVMANHTEKDINYALKAFARVGGELGII